MYLYILGIVTSAVHTKVRSLSVIFCAFIGNIFSKLLFHSVKIYRIHEVLQLTGYKSRKNTKVHAYFIPMSVVFFIRDTCEWFRKDFFGIDDKLKSVHITDM